MVKPLLCAAILLLISPLPMNAADGVDKVDGAKSLSVTTSLQSGLTATVDSEADPDFPATPVTPRLPELEKNHPGEDFLVVTTISLPFTSLYALLGATAIAWSSSGTFPPKYDNSLVTGAIAAAVGTSLTIAAISVNWGGSRPEASTKRAGPAPSERQRVEGQDSKYFKDSPKPETTTSKP